MKSLTNEVNYIRYCLSQTYQISKLISFNLLLMPEIHFYFVFLISNTFSPLYHLDANITISTFSPDKYINILYSTHSTLSTYSSSLIVLSLQSI